MKQVWIGTSWKMNKDARQALVWVNAVKNYLQSHNLNCQSFVIPPFLYVSMVVEQLRGTSTLVGVQNMCWEASGAFTGEISPLMVKDSGAQIVEIGHSERRQFFGETDETVNKKVLAALAYGLTPLVCVGDTAQEKRWNVSTESVVRQVKIALHGVSPDQVNQVMFAYEPVWAIGEFGTPATQEEAELIHQAIRLALTQLYGQAIAGAMYILYGGSVNQENARQLLQQPNIDGLFIGRAAWEALGYCQILSLGHEIS